MRTANGAPIACSRAFSTKQGRLGIPKCTIWQLSAPARYVIDSAADLLLVLAEINNRMARGEKP